MGEETLEEVLLRVKSIITDTEGESSLRCRLESSDGLKFLSSKALKMDFQTQMECLGRFRSC